MLVLGVEEEIDLNVAFNKLVKQREAVLRHHRFVHIVVDDEELSL